MLLTFIRLVIFSVCVHISVVSPTLIVNPTLYVIPCDSLGGLHIYNVATVVTYQVILQPNFNRP
jgi:hypothetical protein